MIRYILRRLLWVIFLLFAVSFVTFVIFYLLPSADPAVLRAGRQANPELVASIRHQLGLDQPWYVQYGRYMKELIFHFDFGFSYQNGVPVRQLIFSRLPASISLAAGAAVLWLVIGIGVGIIAEGWSGRFEKRPCRENVPVWRGGHPVYSADTTGPRQQSPD